MQRPHPSEVQNIIARRPRRSMHQMGGKQARAKIVFITAARTLDRKAEYRRLEKICVEK